MSDDDYDAGDDEIDYDPDAGMDDDNNQDNEGLNYEDNFIEAEHAADPVAAYRELISLEQDNSDEHKWTYKSYEKLSLIFLKQLNATEFEKSIKKLAFFYSKVGDFERQDTFREIVNNIKALANPEERVKYYKYVIEALKTECNRKEYLYVGVEYCKQLSMIKNYKELKNSVTLLMKEIDSKDETLKSVHLQLIIMNIQILKSEGKTVEIKNLYLEANKLMKDQVFEDKFLTGIINEEGGKICMRQKDFNQALQKFKFAFHSYKDSGSVEAVTVLKYAYMMSMLVKDRSIIMTVQEASPYKNDQSLMNIVRLYEAFEALNINLVNSIWKKDIVGKEKDMFIKENLDDILYNIRINYIVKKLQGYKNCKFNGLKDELGIQEKELIGMVMNIAKNGLFDVKINFVKKQIETIEKQEDSASRMLLQSYARWQHINH